MASIGHGHAQPFEPGQSQRSKFVTSPSIMEFPKSALDFHQKLLEASLKTLSKDASEAKLGQQTVDLLEAWALTQPRKFFEQPELTYPCDELY